MISKTCKQCGKEIVVRTLNYRRNHRNDIKFCGATCRKRYSRRGDRAKRATDNIMRDLNAIMLTIKRHPDLRPELNEQLKRLRAEINDILRLSDRETIESVAERNVNQRNEEQTMSENNEPKCPRCQSTNWRCVDERHEIYINDDNPDEYETLPVGYLVCSDCGACWTNYESWQGYTWVGRDESEAFGWEE